MQVSSLFLFSIFFFFSFCDGRMMLVTTPVANLCATPKPWAVSYEIDRNALTQLLFNDLVILQQPPSQFQGFDTSGWLYVEVIQQAYYKTAFKS